MTLQTASQQHPRPIKGVGPAEEGETHPGLLLLLRRRLALHPAQAMAVVQPDAGEHALRGRWGVGVGVGGGVGGGGEGGEWGSACGWWVAPTPTRPPPDPHPHPTRTPHLRESREAVEEQGGCRGAPGSGQGWGWRLGVRG